MESASWLNTNGRCQNLPDLKQIAQAFLKEARADLRSARLLLAGKEYSQTIVHCQHAAEKTLKAALALRHIIITRQHTVSPDFVAAFSDFAEANQLRKAWVARCLELHRDRVGISRDIIERAGRLEADGITALDSLHLACAEVAGAEYFLTCDDRVMGRYAGSLKVLNPVDFVVSVVGVQPWQ